MRAEDCKLYSRFFDENKRQYIIPVYQRNYDWSFEECIGDIKNCMAESEVQNPLYIPKSETLSEFVQTFYDLDIAILDYMEVVDQKGLKSEEDIVKSLDILSLEDLYAVLTLFIRRDRFVTGNLIKLAENGALYEVVKRICDFPVN